MPNDNDFEPSFELVQNSVAKCKSVSKNAIVAQKECFPLLTNKELVVEITEIKKVGNLEIRGHLGNSYYKFECSIDRKNEAKFYNNPNLVEIGEKYLLKGRFERFFLYGNMSTVYFDQCSFKKIKSN